MRRTRFNVETDFEQVQFFIKFAIQYASDYGLPELDHITQLSLPELWEELQKNYELESGEKVIRPKYYWNEQYRNESGAKDCDDQFIQFVARLIYAGYSPSQILVMEVREPHNDYYTHIFAALETDDREIIFLDCLPFSVFNRLDYASNLMRVSRVSDYI